MAVHVDDETRMKQRVQAVTFDGISKEQLLDGYRKWANSYDQDLAKVNTVAHSILADYARQCFPADARPTVRVLDVGAGTGLVGEELHKSGFRNIDALDPCKEMLDKARQKGIYKHFYQNFLSAEKLDIPKGTYDGLVGSGIFAEAGHVPVCALHEMIRLVKSGGYIVLVTRASLVADNAPYKDLEPMMSKLEEDGKWKRIIRAIGPNMYLDRPAITWCYQVL